MMDSINFLKHIEYIVSNIGCAEEWSSKVFMEIMRNHLGRVPTKEDIDNFRVVNASHVDPHSMYVFYYKDEYLCKMIKLVQKSDVYPYSLSYTIKIIK